ncbi:MAG: thioredoxin family protein [Taibaiella sp.]|nr:thioredoxin family protein [Taibaiella sp.]
MKHLLLICVSVMLCSFAAIGSYKPGDTVADFSLLNVDGKMVSMSSYSRAKGFIIVFTCNHCPFAKLYQQRLNEMNNIYSAQDFPLLAISSNDADAVPEDSYEEMAKRSKEKKYNFPYLYDETQAVARAFGAVKTPQAFVVFKENNNWIVKYYGAIDDNGAEPDKVKNKFVIDAVEALLHNQPITVSTTKSVGCGMKWKVQAD